MPRGAPDYSNVRAGTPLHRLDDIAELAVRLGSPVSFERGGKVILIDTFEKGMSRWGSAAHGDGASIVVSSLRTSSPPFSLALTTGRTDAWAAQATIQVPWKYEGKMGFEYAFTHTINSLYHYSEFVFRDGSYRYPFAVSFDIQNGTIRVRNVLGAWQIFAEDVYLKSDAFLFNQGKLIVNTETKYYDTFIFNNTPYDLSAYSVTGVEEESVPYIEGAIQFTGDDGSNRTHYVDNVIITQLNP